MKQQTNQRKWIMHLLMLECFTLPCMALETLAYHFVGEPTCQPRVSECPLLAKAPDATPFVKDGDILRDLTPSVRASGLPIRNGWVLWNETRRWLIVRGAMSDQWWIDSKLGFEAQDDKVEITLDWFRTLDANHPPKEQDAPLVSLEARCLPGGFRADVERVITLKDGDWKFEMEADRVYSGDGVTLVSLQSSVNGPRENQRAEGYVATNVRQEDGKPQIVASWYAGIKNSAWWLRLTTDLVLIDGTSRRNARLREVGEAYVPWPSATPDQPCRTIPEKFRGRVSVSSDIQVVDYMIRKQTGEEISHDVDFAKPGMVEKFRKNVIKHLPKAEIPEWLSEMAAAPLLDLRQAVSVFGVKLGPDDFIAYDPDTFLVIRASKDAATLELLDSVFTGLCGGMRNEVKYETWLENANHPGVPFSRISIISETGMRSIIDWNDPATSTKIFMMQEFSPNGEGKLDVRSEYLCKTRKHDGKEFDWKEKAFPKLVPDQIDVRQMKKSPQDPVIKKFQKAYVSPEH
jgi:hypothetical protein